MFKRIVAILISVCFVFEQVGFAQVAPQLQVPQYLSTLMTPDRFRPVQLRSIELEPTGAGMRIFVDRGDEAKLNADALKLSSAKLLEYFQIGLRLPNSTFWVNLRPDTTAEIIDPVLEKTDLGKVLLAADLQLKKDLAQMTSPDTAEGHQYWTRLYAKAAELYGDSQNMQIPTVTRPWIVPGEVVIRQTQTSAYVYKASLKVMLEQDYLKGDQQFNMTDQRAVALNDYSSALIRELIIPKLTRRVNASRKYADLRQVYYSLVLAQWFKARFKDSRIDNKDIAAFTSQKSWSKDTYYQQYKKSFEQGEYKKEETVTSGNNLFVRQYVSGGVQFAPSRDGGQMAFTSINALRNNMDGIQKSLSELTVNEDKMTLISDADLAVEAGSRDGGVTQQKVDELFATIIAEMEKLYDLYKPNCPRSLIKADPAAAAKEFAKSVPYPEVYNPKGEEYSDIEVQGYYKASAFFKALADTDSSWDTIAALATETWSYFNTTRIDGTSGYSDSYSVGGSSKMSKQEIAEKKEERDDLYAQYRDEEEEKMWDKVGGQFGRSYFDGLTSSQEDEVRVNALNRVADKLYGPRYEIVNGRIREEDITRDGGGVMSLQEIAAKIAERVNDSEYGFDKSMVDAFLADPTNPGTMRPMIEKILAYYAAQSVSPLDYIETQGMYTWAEIKDDLAVNVYRKTHPAGELLNDNIARDGGKVTKADVEELSKKIKEHMHTYYDFYQPACQRSLIDTDPAAAAKEFAKSVPYPADFDRQGEAYADVAVAGFRKASLFFELVADSKASWDEIAQQCVLTWGGFNPTSFAEAKGYSEKSLFSSTGSSRMSKQEIKERERDRQALYKQYREEEEEKMWDKVGGQFGRSIFDGLTSSQEDEVRVAALNRVADEMYGPRYEIVNGRIREEDIARDGGVVSQAQIGEKIKSSAAQVTGYVKDVPIMMYKVDQVNAEGYFDELPAGIREQMGVMDGDNYMGYKRDWDQGKYNNGYVVALQIDARDAANPKPDFYVMSMNSFNERYKQVGIDEVKEKNNEVFNQLMDVSVVNGRYSAKDAKLIGALKTQTVDMVKMSEAGFAVDRKAEIEAPWGGSQTKEAGNDAFLVLEGLEGGSTQYYMVQDNGVGLPQGYVLLDASARDGGKGKNVVGGIDFRAVPLPVAAGAVVPMMDMKALQVLAANAKIADVDAAWKAIEKDIAQKTVPYEQLKNVVAVSCCQKDTQRLNEISARLAQLLKFEEECAVTTSAQMQEVLQMLEAAA